jgi:hypothetical protein
LDSLKKDALAQKESSQKKSKVTTKKIVRKKVSLNDKDYQKHVQTRSIINERIAKVRKSKLEEKILSKVKGQKKDEIQIEAKAGKTVRTAKKTDSKKPIVIQKSKLKTNVDRKPQNKKVAEKPSIKSKARTNSKSSVRAHSKPKKKSR